MSWGQAFCVGANLAMDALGGNNPATDLERAKKNCGVENEKL